MKIDVNYADTVELRFMFERLPYAVKHAIDAKREKLVEKAQKGTPTGERHPIRFEDFVSADGSVYSVEFELGDIRQDSPKEEPIQILEIKKIRVVKGMHGY